MDNSLLETVQSHLFAIDLSQNEIFEQEEKEIFKIKDGYAFLRSENVVYLEADQRHTILYLKDGTSLTLPYQGISSLKDYFNKERGFIQLHRRYIVNRKLIELYHKSKECVRVSLFDKAKWIPVGIIFLDSFEKMCKKKVKKAIDPAPKKLLQLPVKVLLVILLQAIVYISKQVANSDNR